MKKNKTLVLILGVVLAAAVVVGLIFGVKALTRSGGSQDPESGSTEAKDSAKPGTTGDPAADPSAQANTDPTDDVEITPEMRAATAKSCYTVNDIAEDDPRWEQIVATCGEQSLSNRGAQLYYAMALVDFLSDEEMGMYISMLMDLTKPLSEQDSGALGMNWEQYFLMSAMDRFHAITAMTEKAVSEGFTLPESYEKDLNDRLQKIRDDAANAGYESADQFLQVTFAPGVRYEDYAQYWRSYYLAVAYEKKLYEELNVTKEQIQEYYDAHAEDFEGLDKDTFDISVRHILISPETDDEGNATEEAMAAAKAEAEALYAEWKKDPTEENFAKLAGEKTGDPGSKENGGLYEDVYPGRMVQPFNDWCFDSARKPGDTGIVETAYGYHIMYFVAVDDQYHWEKVAENNIRSENIDKLFTSMLEGKELTVNYTDIVLAPLPFFQTGE